MNLLFYFLFSAAGVVILGSVLIFVVESSQENSEINSMLDALWWTVATVTTVGYGDVVPVSNIGKVIAIVYMFFGIGILAMFLSVLSTNFYKKRFEKEEKKISHAQKLILKRIDDLEENQKALEKTLRKMHEDILKQKNK